MIAQTLHCYSCGAAAASDAAKCGHCGARLASICCPACFGMMFRGSKFCPHCGGPAAEWKGLNSKRPCPSCKSSMLQGQLGSIPLHECNKCYGLWLDKATFEQICRDAEKQAAVLGSVHQVMGATALGSVRYLRCPQCRELMHRINFARCSGVIVDVCRSHGTWFDANELHRIVHFIREGGMDHARANEKRELTEQRRRLEAARLETKSAPIQIGTPPEYELLSRVVGATGELVRWWLKP